MPSESVKPATSRHRESAPSSRPAETPQQRQKRKQAEQDRARAQAAQQAAQVSANAKKEENFLKRETPFLCNVRFRCDLPEVPGDPKMMVAPLQAKELAAFKLTSLERAPVRHLSLQPDLGIPFSFLDVDPYRIPAHPQPLAPEDAALVQEETKPALPPHLQAAIKNTPGAAGGNKGELSWLMRTTYISNDTADRRQQGISEKRARAAKQAQEAEEGPALDTVEGQMQAIEAGFEAAQQAPVHQTKPAMKALKVLPVLPDADRMQHSFVNMVFDNDPTAEHDRLAKLSNKQRRRISELAMMKSYALASTSQDGKQSTNRFVAYMVPKEVPQEPAHPSNRQDTDASVMEGEYEWVREYLYDVRQDEEKRTYVLRETPDYMGYVDLNTRLMVHKRGKRLKSEIGLQAQEFPRPAKITVKRLYPDGVEPPLKRQHVQSQQPSQSPAKEAKRDINSSAVGDAEPVDDMVNTDTNMYAGLGLDSSDDDIEAIKAASRPNRELHASLAAKGESIKHDYVHQ